MQAYGMTQTVRDELRCLHHLLLASLVTPHHCVSAFTVCRRNTYIKH